MLQLIDHHADIQKCNACPSLCPWKKFKDADYGSLKSKIMLIGEAPGEKAIANNLTWSGAAGKRLRKIVAPFGTLENLFYMTNVLKCVPPGNRDPAKAEIQNCSGYLKKEIELVSPVVIFTVGRFATDFVFGMFCLEKKPILELHGKEVIIEGKTIVPLLHPSYASVWMKDYDESIRSILRNYVSVVEEDMIGS